MSSIAASEDIVNVEVRKKDYVLDRKKALGKKLLACDRQSEVKVTKSDEYNYVFEYNTAAFEVGRQALLSCFHGSTGTLPTSSRNVSIDVDQEKSGLGVSEVIKIKNWNSIKKPKNAMHSGECKISIHIYKTTSRMLINGKHAEEMVNIFLPVLDEKFASEGESIAELNEKMEVMLIKALEERGSEEDLPRLKETDNIEEDEERNTEKDNENGVRPKSPVPMLPQIKNTPETTEEDEINILQAIIEDEHEIKKNEENTHEKKESVEKADEQKQEKVKNETTPTASAESVQLYLYNFEKTIINTLQDSYDELLNMNRTNSAQEVSSLRAEIDQKQKEIIHLQDLCAERESNIRRELDRGNFTIQKLECENDTLKREMEKAKQEMEKARHAEVRLNIQKMNEIGSISEKHRKEVSEISNKSRREIDDLGAKLTEARAESNRLQSQINKHFEEILSLKATLGAAENPSGFTTKETPFSSTRGENMEKVRFQGESNPLSNFFHIKEGMPVNIDKCVIIFFSAEEAFQYKAAIEANNMKIAQNILEEKDGRRAKELSKEINKSIEWEVKEEEVLTEIVRIKAKCCKEFREELEVTGNRPLEEDTADRKWGRGTYANPGRNIMGKILEKIRRELRNKEGSAVSNMANGFRAPEKRSTDGTRPKEKMMNPSYGMYGRGYNDRGRARGSGRGRSQGRNRGRGRGRSQYGEDGFYMNNGPYWHYNENYYY